MSRRKKDKVKAARAKEAERIANKRAEESRSLFGSDQSSSNVTDSTIKEGYPSQNKKNDEGANKVNKKPQSLKDSKGKKIPTEAERRRKGDIDSLDEHGKGTRAAKEDLKFDRKSNKKASHPKSFKEVMLHIAAHPFIVFVAIVLIAIFITIIYENVPKESEDVPSNTKAISLVGMTKSAETVLDDTGKFDDFWTDENSGISYADLFDYDVTDEEQKILESRGQIMDEETGMFSYNADISSAKSAKEAQQKALSDAGTVLLNQDSQSNEQEE